MVKVPVAGLSYDRQLVLTSLDCRYPCRIQLIAEGNLTILVVHRRPELALDMGFPRRDSIVEELCVALVDRQRRARAHHRGAIPPNVDKLLRLVKQCGHNMKCLRRHWASPSVMTVAKHRGGLVERAKHVRFHKLHAVSPLEASAEETIHFRQHLLGVKVVRQERCKHSFEVRLHHHHNDVSVPSVIGVDVRRHLAPSCHAALGNPPRNRMSSHEVGSDGVELCDDSLLLCSDGLPSLVLFVRLCCTSQLVFEIFEFDLELGPTVCCGPGTGGELNVFRRVREVLGHHILDPGSEGVLNSNQSSPKTVASEVVDKAERYDRA
mmetsp:Transcript_32664/g.98625  ORF Transcript_32664/g.98625 Transcript_32664/m.98625 type:complete len:322 (+) Transcript_32664:301-1266(+)